MNIQPIIRVYPDGTFNAWYGHVGDSPGLDKCPQLAENELQTFLDIEQEEESHDEESVEAQGKRQERKEVKPLTSHAKRTIRSGCALIQDEYGRRNTAFFTGTLPRGDEQEMEEIEKQWHTVVKYMMEKIAYHLCKAGLKPWIVIKTEFQKDGTLHMHAVCPARRNVRAPWALSKLDWKKIWRGTIVGLVPTMKSKKWFRSTRVEVVKKDVLRYMSKYLSKASTVETGTVKSFVKRFWNVTNKLRATLKANILTISFGDMGFTITRLVRILESQSALKYLFPITGSSGGLAAIAAGISRTSIPTVIQQMISAGGTICPN